MKFLISVTVLLCHLNSISADPGIVETSPEFKRSRDKSATISTKLPSYNLITDIVKTTTPSTASSLQSFKITAEDVVTGSNAVYGSSSNLQNGGIIFAISQGQGSTSQPLMSAAPPQPVLMQFLSPEGTPKQAAVQYIQLLRPLMMVQPSSYMQAKSNPSFDSDYNSLPISPSPTPSPSFTPFPPYTKAPIAGGYSSPQTSYFQTSPQLLQDELNPTSDLNLNEYIPLPSSQRSSVSSQRASVSPHHAYETPQRAAASSQFTFVSSPHVSASSQHAPMILAPRAGSMFPSFFPFAPRANNYKPVAQRA